LQTADIRADVDLYVELLMKVLLGERNIAVGGLPTCFGRHSGCLQGDVDIKRIQKYK